MSTRTTAAGVGLAAGYLALFRLGATWGATAEERRARLPGDGSIRHPTLRTTHAITIDAAAERVWPWLVQMGWGRAGWYTYRWVDRLLFPANGPSASEIVPELQQLAVGDRILDGAPETDCWFRVEILDPRQHLVLRSTTHAPRSWRERWGVELEWVWSWHLSEPAAGRTRLVQRNRMSMRPGWVEVLFFGTIVPADFVMARSHLRAIGRLAEASGAAGSTRRRPVGAGRVR